MVAKITGFIMGLTYLDFKLVTNRKRTSEICRNLVVLLQDSKDYLCARNKEKL